MKLKNKFLLFTLLIMLSACISTRQVVKADTQENDSSTQVLDLSKYKNQETEISNGIDSQLNTLGYAKVWKSGGRIWYSFKATDKRLIVYYLTGRVKIHYNATKNHKARNVYRYFHGWARIGKTWTDSKPYNTAYSGYAVITGTIDGIEGYIKFPSVHFYK